MLRFNADAGMHNIIFRGGRIQLTPISRTQEPLNSHPEDEADLNPNSRIFAADSYISGIHLASMLMDTSRFIHAGFNPVSSVILGNAL
jgi:hypothetical protein